MIIFCCDIDGCPNQGVKYYWGDSSTTQAQCGGCGTILYVVIENADSV